MYDVVTVLCLVAKAQFTAIDSQSDIASKRYKYVVIYPSNLVTLNPLININWWHNIQYQQDSHSAKVATCLQAHVNSGANGSRPVGHPCHN